MGSDFRPVAMALILTLLSTNGVQLVVATNDSTSENSSENLCLQENAAPMLENGSFLDNQVPPIPPPFENAGSQGPGLYGAEGYIENFDDREGMSVVTGNWYYTDGLTG